MQDVKHIEAINIVPAPMTVEQAVTFYAMLNDEGKAKFLEMLTDGEREAIRKALNPNYKRDVAQADKVLQELGIDTK